MEAKLRISREAATLETIMQIVEIARTAHDVSSLRAGVIPILQKRIGCDSVYWGAASTMPTTHRPVQVVSDAAVRTAVDQYTHDPGRYDAPTALTKGAIAVASDDELFTSRERDRLPLYTEILRPAGIRTYLGCLVQFRGAASSFVTFSRHGRGTRFADAEKDFLRKVQSIVGLTEALLTQAQDDCENRSDAKLPRADMSSMHTDDLSPALTERFHITPAEHRIVTLMERGLTNREIAAILGLSVNTVRNSLASIFIKLGVSRRSEAVYLLRTLAYENR